MDFLDSLDLDTTYKKCHRVQSWYLYEQYKSLEKNQLYATERLRNKCYQDDILKKELKERRARRKLCDNFSSRLSEPQIEKNRQGVPTKGPLSLNLDDLCVSFCDLDDEHFEIDDFEIDFSNGSSHTSKHSDCRTSLENIEDSDNESVHSVIKNVTFNKNLADDVKRELEIVKENIADNINQQLETVKENIECMEKFTKLVDVDDNLLENDSSDLFEQCESSQVCVLKEDKTFCNKDDKELFPPWTKMVAYAYERVQFNHGNFYNSYSSQLMLAVLLCDVLSRGIYKICNILQPYVSPIKYASDSDASVESSKTAKRKTTNCLNKCLSVQYKNSPKCDCSKHAKSYRKSVNSCRRSRRLLNREYQSENKCQKHSKCSLDNRLNELRCNNRSSEPWECVTKFMRAQKSNGKSSRSSIWPEDIPRAKLSARSVCKCQCLKNVAAPILQIARYIESILQDIEE